MAIALNNLVEKSRTITIYYNGNPITVTYDPSKMTPSASAKLQEMRDDGDSSVGIHEFCEYVMSWDVVGPLYDEADPFHVPAGQVIPVTPEHLAEIPLPLLGRLLQEVVTDAFPKSPTQRGSSRR